MLDVGYGCVLGTYGTYGITYGAYIHTYAEDATIYGIRTIHGENMNTGSEGSAFNIQSNKLCLPDLEYAYCILHGCRSSSNCVHIEFKNIKYLNIKSLCNYASSMPKLKKIVIGCRGDRTDPIIFGTGTSSCTDIEIGDVDSISIGTDPSWWPNQPINISAFKNLDKDNIISHIFNRLKDNNGHDKITITIPKNAYDQMTDDDKQIVVDKNYTLANA